MKKLFLMLAGAVLVLGADEISIKRMNVFPRNYRDKWQNRVLSRTADMKSVCIYSWIAVKTGGAMSLKLKYRLEKGASANVVLSFMKENGKPGDAGKKKYKLPEGTGKIAEITFVADIPKNAHRAQIFISLPFGNAKIELMKITLDHASDQIGLPKATLSGMPSEWKNAAVLRNFYLAAGGGPAKVQTTVKMAYDDANLYVGYICDEPAMAFLKAGTKERDGAVWQDDDVELFLFDPDRNKGWQFILNSANVQFDGELRQAQAGDPYRTFGQWNGDWHSAVRRNAASWEAVIIIPWKILDYPKVPDILSMNFSRKRINGSEVSHWNAFAGNLNDVSRFARASFGEQAGIVRYRKLETASFLPKRKRRAGKELLTAEKGNYPVLIGRFHSYPCYYPPAMRAEFNRERQKKILERYAKLGSRGPELPWAAKKQNILGGIDEILRLHREFGTVCEYVIYSSANGRMAIRKYKCPLYCSYGADCATPEYLRATLDVIDTMGNFCRKPGQRELVAGIQGIDEPTNLVPLIYNRKANPGIADALNAVDTRVKRETGFGKYGMHDFGTTPDADTPFRRIAFWRYWNRRFAEYLEATVKAVRSVDPNLRFQGFNRNTCSGICNLDLALHTTLTREIGCDPYPTSARSSYGMARAIYHTGFTVKLLHDLACRSRTRATLQGFIYHGGRPKPAELREWASQAIKNGAVYFRWYDEGPAEITMPDAYAEMERLTGEITSMNKLALPKETVSAILYSDYDRWGLDDRAGHAPYTVYALLGEHVKANFRFVSPTGLDNGVHTLDGIKVLYIPRMRYTDPATTARLLKFVRGGGQLVIFDPTVWSWNIDGSPVPERLLLTGPVRPRQAITAQLGYGKERLPVAAAANLGRETDKAAAFDFVNNETAVLARYPDGKPAAVERKLGSGKVVYFAVQPFGCSDAALEPEGWPEFFRGICSSVGEKTGLPIWDFVLPGK